MYQVCASQVVPPNHTDSEKDTFKGSTKGSTMRISYDFEQEVSRILAFLEVEYGFQRAPLTVEGLVAEIIYSHFQMGLWVWVTLDIRDRVVDVSISPSGGNPPEPSYPCAQSLLIEMGRLYRSYAAEKEWARIESLIRASYSDESVIPECLRFQLEAWAFALRQGGKDLLRRFQECFGLTERQ